MIDDPLFDTCYVEGRFVFESEAFAQGEVASALAWASRRGVVAQVCCVCSLDGSAVLRSRRRFETREGAERAMASFLLAVDRSELRSRWFDGVPDDWPLP